MSWTYTRVTSRTIVGLSADRSIYTVALELSLKGILQRGGGDPGGFPLPPPCAAGTGAIVSGQQASTELAAADLELPNPPAVGNTVIVYGQERSAGADDPDPPIGFTDAGAGLIEPFETHGAVWYRHVEAGDSATIAWAGGSTGQPPTSGYVEERVGQLTPESFGFVNDVDPGSFPGDFPGATLTPTAGRLGAIVGYAFMKRDEALLTAGTGWTLVDALKVGSVVSHAVVETLVTSTTGSYTPQFHTSTGHVVHDDHSYGAITVAWLCDAGATDNPPSPGQWVRDEVVTMTGASGTTRFPFATGSLSVHVDLTDQTGAIVSQDGATGEFTLAFDPTPHEEVVTVSYQGR